MILRGSDRLRVLLMGAATVGFVGSQHFVLGDGTVPSAPSSKKSAPSAPMPAQPAQQPTLLPVPNLPVIVPVGQSQGASSGKSEVQRQLELLYEQDGREMPSEMNMDIQPVPIPGSPEANAANGGNSAGGSSASGTNAAPNASNGQMPQQRQAQPAPADAKPASKNPVMSFFRKLKPGSKEKPTPAPNDYRPDVAPLPPESSAPAFPKRPQPRTHIDYAPAQLNVNPQPVNVPPSYTNPNTMAPVGTPSGSRPQLPVLDGEARAPMGAKSPSISDLPPLPASTISMPPTVDSGLPPLMTQSLPPQASPAQIAPPQIVPSPGMPPLQVTPSEPAVPQAPAVQAPQIQVPPVQTPQVQAPLPQIAPPAPPAQTPPPEAPAPAAERPATSEFVNPFTEMSEAEADKKLGPFTGLTLEDDAGKAPAKSNAGNAPVAAKDSVSASNPVAAKETAGDEDPFAEELRKMGIVPPGSESNQPVVKQPVANKPAEAKPIENKPIVKPTTPIADSPTFDGIENQSTREKMRKIHERGGMKGLKGFCPVTLHDHRELVDAKSDFHSTYRGQKFHFADAEAKLRFDEDPSRYAPAAYGADVVALTRDKDVVEGTLDYAAWFKGRLYLFGTQEAHDTFVGNPGLYATPVGIE